MKLLNLNMWNYNDFDKRKELIINFIQKHSPDIITLQEVRDDSRFNKEGDNQAKQIAEAIGYNHVFTKSMDKNVPNERVIEGLAILSKEPIQTISETPLKKHPDDKYTRSILHAKIGNQDIINVHFSPTDEFAKLQLIETLEYGKSKNIYPIIVGDFNLRDLSILDEIELDGFTFSTQFKKYVSKPPYTLDIITIPNKLKFTSLECVDVQLSDHKVLISEIR